MSDEQRRRGKKIGCLVLIAFAAITYIGNILILSIPNATNKAKWERQGITHYEIVVDNGSFAFTAGRNQIVVQDGKTVEGFNETYCQPDNPPCEPDVFTDLVVEEQFKIPSQCYWLFPLFICQYKYNSQFGYPEYTSFNGCLTLGTECEGRTEVVSFKPLP